MSRTITAIAAAAAIGFIGVSNAAADDKKFEDLDTNKDSKLSLSEYTAGKIDAEKTSAESKFKKLDANSDGSLTSDEFRKGQDDKKDQKKDEKKPQ